MSAAKRQSGKYVSNRKHAQKRGKNRFSEAYVRPFLMIIGILLCVIMAVLLIGKAKEQLLPKVNDEVLAYEDVIEKYAKAYDMTAYVPLIESVMMQESRGRGGDVMQCSACIYNTEYSTVPNSITDPEYSIQVGIQYLKHCLEVAGCRNERDMENIRLALQGYNYGSGYISWALENYGGYTEENAYEFSEMMKAKENTSVYGDPLYVPHVLRFYIYE